MAFEETTSVAVELTRSKSATGLIAVIGRGLICLFVAHGSATHVGGATMLVAEGKPKGVIVVAKDAAAPEQFAAGELQAYVAEMSGARLPIAHQAGAGPAIVVGGHPLANRIIVEARYPGDDVFRLSRQGDLPALRLQEYERADARGDDDRQNGKPTRTHPD